MSRDRSLRILVVLPLYGGSLPVGRFSAAGLRELGHTVEVFEAPDFYASYTCLENLKVTPDRLEFLQNSYLQTVAQAVMAKVETFEPDLVLAMAQAPLTHQVLKRLRREGVATAMWFVEDYRLFTYWQSFAPAYDVFAVIQKGVFFDELRKIGQENALYLPLAAQPDFHRPAELDPASSRTFGSDVSFMGAGYPNRRVAFRRLAGYDFKIWGTEWDGEHALGSYVQRGGARVSSEDCVKIFNAAKVNLNLHSSVTTDNLVPGGDFVNPRTFELAMCGAFQLVDERSLLPELFSEGELATFATVEEMVALVDHYLGRPEERAAIADRARKRALSDHTYARRMQTLLDFVSEHMPDWPRERQRDSGLFGPDYPEDLKQGLQKLLSDLGLPENAAFMDVVWAVRSKKGELGDLEAAVLFLDEWRKQYNKET